MLSRVQLFATPWAVFCQAPLSMGFSRQEYWSGLPFSSPEDLPDPGIKPHLFRFLCWQEDSFPLVPPGKLTLAFSHSTLFHQLLPLQNKL